MNVLWRWIKRALLILALLVAGLIAPVIYTEIACRGEPVAQGYAALLPPETHRAESRTFMTYPEWHIVHAYDDYAQVIAQGDPHDFGFLRSIGGYWSSLCALNRTAAAHGGVDGGTKQMVYVIGVSFTLELLLKAAYEETLGRVTTLLRGPLRSQADDLSARQAADYAQFLQQVPWYKWDFRSDAAALSALDLGSGRDRERAMALGLEYRAKAAYAQLIAAAVAGVGADALSLQMVVQGPEAALDRYPDVRRIATRAEGIVIEVPRYRALTRILADMADDGVAFVEIAGNDDIMLTALSSLPTHPRALHSFARQGYGDYRHLIVVKVTGLAETLRGLAAEGLRLEHIHDY